MDSKSNGIPALAPLLDDVAAVLGSLTGMLFIADALHTQTGHAREIAARGASLLVRVKANQPWCPLVVAVTGDSRNDVTQVLPLVDALPAISGQRSRPRRRFPVLVANRGYDSLACAGSPEPAQALVCILVLM